MMGLGLTRTKIRKINDSDITKRLDEMLKEPQMQVRDSRSFETDIEYLIRKIEKCKR